MTQYLLSVHMVEGVEPPPADEIQRMYKESTCSTQKIQDAGRVGLRRRAAPGQHRHGRAGPER